MASVMLVFASIANASTITVTTTGDTVANDGLCSLREAITAAAMRTPSGSAPGECVAGSGDDTIVLGVAVYGLTRLGSSDDLNATGDLDITSGAVTIVGTGEATTTVDANGIDRVFDVRAGATLTLRNLAVAGGRAPSGAAAAAAAPGAPGGSGASGGESKAEEGAAGAGGGAIRNAGTLTLEQVAVNASDAGNGGAGGTAGGGGGGGNSAAADGGAGGESLGGRGGSGGGGGGLLSTAGTVKILNSTFTEDLAGNGAVGGSCATGGAGGNGGGNGTGGTGGGCFGGSGGSGGAGGAIQAEAGVLSISNTAFTRNFAGSGGAGGAAGQAGRGGNGSVNGNGGEGGFAAPGPGGSGGSGGGISTRGVTLTLTDSTLSGNEAGAGGVTSSTGAGGDGGTGGGGGGSGGGGGGMTAGNGGEGGSGGGLLVFSEPPGLSPATLAGDTLFGNRAGAGLDGGDAIHGGGGGSNGGGGGSAGFEGPSFGGFGGRGGTGGGAFLQAEATLTDVTLNANAAGGGGVGGDGGSGPGESIGGKGGSGGLAGAIFGGATGTLTHVTASGNSLSAPGAGGSAGTGSRAQPGPAGESGAGADIFGNRFGAPYLTLTASIVGLCGGSFNDGGGNIAAPAVTPCPGTVAEAGLAPLADNGGPTETMALTPTSLAVNLIPPPCGPAPDQRGVARPQGAGCDAGAYELAPPNVSTGGASLLGSTTADVAGTVNPNARATTWHVEYGPTSAYTSRTPDQALAGGLTPDAVSAALTGLRAGSIVHYRVVATNADGTTTGADATLTTTTPTKFAGVVIAKRTLRASRTGRFSLLITCPATTRGRCTGTVTVSTKVRVSSHGRKRTKTVTLAHATFSLAPSARVTLHLKLGRSGRALLHRARHGALSVIVSAAAKDTSGARASTAVAVKLTRSR